MSLTRLLIRDFRNIESADLALSPGFNFLVGANGSGKTSVLEAIYTLGHGRAFRSLQIGRVIRHEQDPLFCTGVCRGGAGNRHRPDQRQAGRQQGAHRRHRRPQSGGAGAADADAADYAGGVYFTQRRPQIQKSVPRLGMLSQRSRFL
jgi:recombinational DNA repair ATPase RecF